MTNLGPLTPSRFDSTLFLKKKIQANKVKNVIDIGCGKLFFRDLLSELNFKGKYTGIDLNPKNPVNGSKRNRVIKADFLSYKTEEKFDLAVCLWVLEHIKNDEKAFEKIHGLLTKDGILVLAVPSVWSWPFEFGRHGFHYYKRRNIIKLAKKVGFSIEVFHEAGGFLGFIFMIPYNWIRYIILIAAVVPFKLSQYLKLTNKNWKEFSRNLIANTLYAYHRSSKGLAIHNALVKNIVGLDDKFKLLPASYLLILKK